jgi:NADH-quinone oxidoreductase subunit M
MNILLLILIIPIVAGLASFAVEGKNAWYIGVITSMATLLLSLSAFMSAADGVVDFRHEWISSIGANFNLSMNAISFLMCLLTSIVFLLTFIVLANKGLEKSGRFFGLMLLSQAGLLGVFLAYDAMLFYIFWELALLPVYFLCSFYGGENRIKASFKFFIYTFVGSLIMLIAILYVGQQGVVKGFAWEAMVANGNSLSSAQQQLIFWAFFVAFAIKMPVFPFHTWQPDTYEQSKTPVTIVLSALMVKMGLFAIMLWLLPILPKGCEHWMNAVLVLCVISIVYASCLALVQKNIKRLVAYSSIAHIGLMCAALFSFQAIGREGVIFQMFNHGINILGLWLIVHIIEDRLETQDLSKMGGIAKVAPLFTIALVLISLANIALPLTNSFPGEFMMFTSLFTSGSKYAIVLTVFAGLSIILGAVYTLGMVQKIAFGPTNELTKEFKDLRWNEWLPLVAIMIGILAVGFFPNILFNVIKIMQ